MPPVLQGTQVIEEIAQIYLHGDKDCALPKHTELECFYYEQRNVLKIIAVNI